MQKIVNKNTMFKNTVSQSSAPQSPQILTLKNQQLSRWYQFDSQQAINQAALQAIFHAASSAIAAKGSFSIVLAGGSTPKSIYALLAKQSADWANWHVYINDDRCLPIDHIDRNSKMVSDVWLSHVNVPKNQIHNIPSELGPIEGAKAYNKTLANVGTFDLVLFGLGEDGHTASLFPDHAIDNSADVVPVFDSPKPPAERVTMSQHRLNNTDAALFLVTGSGKQWAVDSWRNNVAIPASLITPACGVDVYCFGVVLK
jgi:6-phosphogluconolactonase